MSWRPFVLLARGLAAMLVGYAAVAALTYLGFEKVLAGRPLYGGAPFDLVAGMLVAVIAGIVGGGIAGFVGPWRGRWNAALVLLPLAADTIFVLFFSKSTAPFWFDAVASGALMAFTILGGLLSERGRRVIP